MPNKRPRAWFADAIGIGLKGLRAMRPEGHPGADEMEPCTIMWIEALWRERHWDAALDAPRIQTAFDRLAVGMLRWPMPAQFLRLLPDRAQPLALPETTISPEKRAQVRARLADLRASLGKPPAGAPTKGKK
ncbi:hypothetical protein [Rhodoferax sp.]|uniref:hypothetical protein n=1 Tax=Rhodoferax sp. TaxID=50421 RepID=UPI002602259B|nr:hypothetical protein [Rhodoferax sp.]MDD3938026.1 hypothetical protein [Rhodoferax sp.]